VSAKTLERPHPTSSPAWHPVHQACVAARTPLVVTPMQAVSAGPRRAPRSILPLTPSSCLTRRLLADAGVPGDDQNKNQVDSLCALRDDDAGEVNRRPKSPF
jgi:hypothetical protein